ncbi:protein G12-like [Anopheles moucheti]|uniref:protein G12-like n=1 Tax=Anopheles moucheti TaxID=186751 RepID=UPI0022F0DE30|nr:protein G12-like [Anopheles moucheti]
MKLAVIVAACLVATVACAPTQRALTDDFDDFVELLPLEDLLSLALRYLVSDKEVQQVLLYLQGKEFGKVWDQFFALTAVQDLLNYLEEAGVPAYESLNVVADFLGLTPLKPNVRSLRTGGLNGLLEETLAMLPLEELEALFEEKMKTSTEFKALFEKLQKFDHKQLRDLYETSAEVKGMVQKLRDLGVDVDHIVEVVKDFFGWTPTQRALTDDFDDFVELLPLDDLLSLALRYLVSDKEVQQVLLYLQGKEFGKVWDQFFALTAVQDLLNYLEEAGVPAYESLNVVADFLGLTPLKPNVRSLRTGGLNGLLEETLAMLPLEELEALFEEKMKTSTEFKALFEKLQKFDHKQLRDLYETSAEVKGMVQKLRDLGVDVDHIVEVVKDFFGWN